MSLESSSSLRDDHEEASDQLRPVESSYMTTTGEEVLYELLFANSINRPTHKVLKTLLNYLSTSSN